MTYFDVEWDVKLQLNQSTSLGAMLTELDTLCCILCFQHE